MTDSPINLPMTIAGVRVRRLLDVVRSWAEMRPDVVAVALVGSWARNAARPDSGVDLLLLVRDVAGYLAFPAWLDAFGKPTGTTRVDRGALPALRVWFADGPEVEVRLTTPDWGASDPVAPGTAEIVRGGLVAVYDPDEVLARLVAAVGQGST